MFAFQKIWRALLSCYLRFEIHPFTLLPTNYASVKSTSWSDITFAEAMGVVMKSFLNWKSCLWEPMQLLKPEALLKKDSFDRFFRRYLGNLSTTILYNTSRRMNPSITFPLQMNQWRICFIPKSFTNWKFDNLTKIEISSIKSYEHETIFVSEHKLFSVRQTG